ncbi:hypothetical protein K466DRAFT_357445 [Polyporus arcularius HHB13444]|uniref:Uncharacterized protein n=1 Tax=Polyporus arcularius HHB13444 TaxID=1314778 RepID=A0A5C3NU76_9APHY|nr:hypothetical protein K466DRAFT_357445 [Polyporus arcularius HHB13444]
MPLSSDVVDVGNRVFDTYPFCEEQQHGVGFGGGMAMAPAMMTVCVFTGCIWCRCRSFVISCNMAIRQQCEWTVKLKLEVQAA